MAFWAQSIAHRGRQSQRPSELLKSGPFIHLLLQQCASIICKICSVWLASSLPEQVCLNSNLNFTSNDQEETWAAYGHNCKNPIHDYAPEELVRRDLICTATVTQGSDLLPSEFWPVSCGMCMDANCEGKDLSKRVNRFAKTESGLQDRLGHLRCLAYSSSPGTLKESQNMGCDLELLPKAHLA